MMAGPVVKALAGDDEKSATDRKALLHGTVMYIILLTLAVIARFYWTTFIGPVGFAVLLVYAFACLGVMSLDDQGKAFSFATSPPHSSRGSRARTALSKYASSSASPSSAYS
jgi:hypothetical protein